MSTNVMKNANTTKPLFLCSFIFLFVFSTTTLAFSLITMIITTPLIVYEHWKRNEKVVVRRMISEEGSKSRQESVVGQKWNWN